MLKYSIILLFFFVNTGFFVRSNSVIDPYAELGLVLEIWNNQDDLLKCNIEMARYPSLGEFMPEDVTVLEFVKKGQDSYLRTDRFEAISVESFNVYFDLLEKEMRIYPFSQEALAQPMQNIKDFILLTKRERRFKVVYEEIPHTPNAKVVISAPGTAQTVLDIVFDKESHLLKYTDLLVQVEGDPYQPFNKQRMLTTYKDFEILDKMDFPFRKKDFVRKVKSTYQSVQKRHKGFKVLNYLKNEG